MQARQTQILPTQPHSDLARAAHLRLKMTITLRVRRSTPYLYKGLVAHYRATLEPEDPLLSATYCDLAQARTVKGEYNETITLCERVHWRLLSRMKTIDLVVTLYSTSTTISPKSTKYEKAYRIKLCDCNSSRNKYHPWCLKSVCY